MDPGPVRDGLTLGLGVVTGILSASFGVGGAVVSTPGLRLLGASAIVSVGTTLPSILPSALAGTARYAREGLVDWRVVASIAPVASVAAVAGSLSSHAVPGEGRWLMLLTAAILLVTAWRLRDEGRTNGEQHHRPTGPRSGGSRTKQVSVGAGAGLLSGLLGIGGGAVLVPGLTQVMGMPIKEAISTSLACVGLIAIPATVTHAFLDGIDWRMALWLAVGVVPGARIGAAAAIRTDDRRLRLAVAAGLGLLGVAYAAGEIRALVR